MRYARTICAALCQVDAPGSSDYRAWTDAYCAQLRVVDAWVKQQIAALPQERRVLVTSHDALGYFARPTAWRSRPWRASPPGRSPMPRTSPR